MHTNNVYDVLITKKNGDAALRRAVSVVMDDGVIVVYCESITNGVLHLYRHTTMQEVVKTVEVDRKIMYKCDC